MEPLGKRVTVEPIVSGAFGARSSEAFARRHGVLVGELLNDLFYSFELAFRPVGRRGPF